MANANFVLKVTDAKAADIQKALKDAGITVRSLQEVHRDAPAPAEEAAKEARV